MSLSKGDTPSSSDLLHKSDPTRRATAGPAFLDSTLQTKIENLRIKHTEAIEIAHEHLDKAIGPWSRIPALNSKQLYAVACILKAYDAYVKASKEWTKFVDESCFLAPEVVTDQIRVLLFQAETSKDALDEKMEEYKTLLKEYI